MKYSLKLLMRSTALQKVASSLQRSIRMVSAPNISGTSVSSVVPPWRASRSDVQPSSGLAVMPDRPSLPPHLRPMTSSEASTVCRLKAEA